MKLDDDEVSRYVLRQHLAGIEADIIEASGGTAGLASAIEKQPDAILLDLKMPDLDGFSVLDALGRDQRTKGVPVAVVTASVVSRADLARLPRATAVMQKSELSAETLKAFLDQNTEIGVPP